MRSDQVRLNCGITMPLIGFGTYSFPNDRKTTELAVHNALKMGYRHFDTAKIYGSEAAVGNALNEAMNEGRVERHHIFLTSKLWCSDHHDPLSALNQTLQNVGMEYLDMYLVHWPVKLKEWVNYPIPKEEDFDELDLESTWRGMEKCLDMGLCRCIGVSNFSSNKILSLLDFASTPPAVNQKLRETCGAEKIHVSAYSPLGGPGNAWGSTAVVDHPTIRAIGRKHNATSGESFNQERMKQNIGAFDLKLDDQDLFEIDNLEERKIMRGEFLVNQTTSPYKTIQQLWDDEI
ncbi:Non-functional NADPH-dependent codeinone reductase 2 [Senna tora]|uniref:Non-functional NADPH-dependent codeinone reductase 2 n=1 Tax=Senna tora TaxID=362788 RepID=A0A835CAE0_9FABA|nr:Non-functional NADPH-dependent codeinone reductase 2 [Senna tora]